jgi:hypothetical protein
MARLLSTDLCSVVIDDRISGTKMKLFYRLPSTKERVEYMTRKFASLKKADPGVKEQETINAVRLAFGLDILAGFQKGAFAVPGPDGDVLLSSKEGEEGYDPGWKGIVEDFAADIVEELAFHVFENSIAAVPGGAADPF